MQLSLWSFFVCNQRTNSGSALLLITVVEPPPIRLPIEPFLADGFLTYSIYSLKRASYLYYNCLVLWCRFSTISSRAAYLLLMLVPLCSTIVIDFSSIVGNPYSFVGDDDLVWLSYEWAYLDSFLDKRWISISFDLTLRVLDFSISFNT